MKGVFIFGFGLFSLAALAAQPDYYKGVHGTLVTGLFDRGTFDFVPGTLSSCTESDVGPLVHFHCAVDGASMQVAAGGKVLKFTPNDVHVFYKRQQDGRWIHEYHFKAPYQEPGAVTLQTDAELVLWNYEGVPTDIKGSFSLKDYGVFGAIQASDGQR